MTMPNNQDLSFLEFLKTGEGLTVQDFTLHLASSAGIPLVHVISETDINPGSFDSFRQQYPDEGLDGYNLALAGFHLYVNKKQDL